MSQTLIPSTRNTEAYNAGSLCVSPVPLPQSSVTSGLSLDLPKLLLPEEDSLPICKFPANSNSPFCWPEHIPAPDLVTDLVTSSDQQLHATRGESLLGQKLPESECEFTTVSLSRSHRVLMLPKVKFSVFLPDDPEKRKWSLGSSGGWAATRLSCGVDYKILPCTSTDFY